LALGAAALAGGASDSSDPAAAPLIGTYAVALQMEKSGNPATKQQATKHRATKARSARGEVPPTQPDAFPQPQSDTAPQTPGAPEPRECVGEAPEPAGDIGPDVNHEESGDHQGENGGGSGTGGDNGALTLLRTPEERLRTRRANGDA
jgi:hypothetical protein